MGERRKDANAVMMMGGFTFHFSPCTLVHKCVCRRVGGFSFVWCANQHFLEVVVEKEIDVCVAARLDALGKVLLVQRNRLQCAADVHAKASHQALSVQAVRQLLQLCLLFFKQQQRCGQPSAVIVVFLIFGLGGNKRRVRTSQRPAPWLSARLRSGGSPSAHSALRCGTRQDSVPCWGNGGEKEKSV